MMQTRCRCGNDHASSTVAGDRTSAPMGEDAPEVDPRSLIRTRQYRVMLVFAAAIGLLVSTVSWGYLELVHYIQNWVYKDLPNDLGYTALTPGDLGHSTIPWWYPLPWLAPAGGLTPLAIPPPPGGGRRGARAGRRSRKRGFSHTADRAPGRRPRRVRHVGARARARAGGTADRNRDGPRNAGDSADQERGA